LRGFRPPPGFMDALPGQTPTELAKSEDTEVLIDRLKSLAGGRTMLYPPNLGTGLRLLLQSGSIF
jgi:hypothetical protein